MKSDLLITLLLSACLAFAAPPKPKTSANHPQQSASVSFLLNSFDYSEEFPPPGKSTENGWLFGIGLRYTFEGGTELPLYGKIQFEFSPSGTEYGSNEEDALGRLKDFTQNTSNWFSRLEFQTGYTFYRIANAPVDITPYAGYGYRFWRREISSHNDLQGYREDYSWSYIPIGVKGELAIDRHWSVGLDVAMRLMVSGSISIGLPTYNSPTLTLGNRLGLYMAVPLEYRPSSVWAGAFTLWYESSGIDQSNKSPIVVVGGVQHQIYEPPSTTRQFGFSITGMFLF
jgi:hypothetical protein